jgi:hypothetical protein
MPAYDQYDVGHRDGQKAEREKVKALLKRIAEIDGLIECSSLQDWREKVKKMAANALKGMK